MPTTKRRTKRSQVSKTRYVAKKGAPITDQDASNVAEVCNEMLEGGVRITRAALLKRAADVKSPIHNLFVWDDKVAAHRHRLQIAGQLINSVQQINIQTKEPEQALYKIRVQNGDTHTEFLPKSEVATNQDMLAQVSHKLYVRILNIVKQAESLGLAEESAWRNIANAVHANTPEAVEEE
jgi:hypothetical protein